MSCARGHLMNSVATNKSNFVLSEQLLWSLWHCISEFTDRENGLQAVNCLCKVK